MATEADFFNEMLHNVFDRIQALRRTASLSPSIDNAYYTCQKIFLDEAKAYADKCGELNQKQLKELEQKITTS